MALTDIGKFSENAERFISDLAQSFREKRWVKILSLAGVVFALLLNPPSVKYGLEVLGSGKPDWYSYPVWLLATASLFVAAFLVALLTRKRDEAEVATAATSIIKGLLPYTNTKEDAEWFARLQRGSILQDCLRFSAGEDLFAVLSGESGTGKTSFLQAGLSPNLSQRGHRPIYVKLTDSEPPDSIRQALDGGGERPAPDGQQRLVELLRQATREDSRPAILILDQFEQFFAHHKSKASRKAFIQQMAEWHKRGGRMPVKVLVSIRGDFVDRLHEFQREMEYTLTPHNMLRLEKFEPQEAAQVLGVIAGEAKIELDEGFIKELTRHELADREDGTVSPVDIQILSWMVDGQKSSEERAFNRKAFQKLGGVEGLLERFLSRALNTRETDARRDAVIKVMLALTDQNVRAGALSLKALKEKLSGVIPDEDVEEAVSWLAKSEVRLVTPIQEKGVTLYELAHERIIPPLRRLVFKETTDVERAQQTLDRRVNEWVGNNRARRYLLTFREWWLIKRYRPLINLGSQKEQKEEFITLSKRRFLTTALSLAAALLLGSGGYAAYTWYERRPETQIRLAQNRLVELLAGTKDTKAARYAALLLSVLGGESSQELSQKLWQQINRLDAPDRVRVLASLAEAYIELSKTDDAVATLDKAQQAVAEFDDEHVDSSEKIDALRSLTEAYGKLPKTDEAVKGLDKMRQLAEKLGSFYKSTGLLEVAEAYVSLSKTDEALKLLEQVLRPTPGNSPRRDEETEVALTLSRVMDIYRSLLQADGERSNTDQMIKVLDRLWQMSEQLPRYQTFLFPLLAKAYARLTDSGEAVKGLNKLRQRAEKLDSAEQRSMFVALIGAYGRFSNLPESVNGLNEIEQAAEKLEPLDRARVFASLAEAYGKLSKTDRASAVLNKAQRVVEQLNPSDQAEGMDALMQTYTGLSSSGEAVKGLNDIEQAAERLEPGDRARVLVSLAETYDKLSKTDEALKVLGRSRRVIEEGDPDEQVDLLTSLVGEYESLSKTNEALEVLDRALQTVEKVDSSRQARLLLYLADDYKKLSKTEGAAKALDMAQSAVEKAAPSDQAEILLSLAEKYYGLGKTDEVMKTLVRAQQAANAMSSDDKSSALIKVATMYARLHKWREAIEVSQSIGSEVYVISAFSRILIIWRDAKNGSKHMEALEKLFERVGLGI